MKICLHYTTMPSPKRTVQKPVTWTRVAKIQFKNHPEINEFLHSLNYHYLPPQIHSDLVCRETDELVLHLFTSLFGYLFVTEEKLDMMLA
jgi:hypothetical protein